ncbi:hypothetical protein CR203_11240 [Salipaludibacillus neizhouensis]|uniref:Uncharacterized protein n=1 Tax=Salipaludibacillus neizhouensis TaxID=885475 RepID=A0A3A9K989_9BACI|nr:hypothetical protein [Salipaludibacillus neizhouensis]RKL67082.1 hypothetical protein CR203_11240 [Salipaludibacillus neizhouensis]
MNCWTNLKVASDEGRITPELLALTSCIKEIIDEETIIMSGTITNFSMVNKHLPRVKAGTYFTKRGEFFRLEWEERNWWYVVMGALSLIILPPFTGWLGGIILLF